MNAHFWQNVFLGVKHQAKHIHIDSVVSDTTF